MRIGGSYVPCFAFERMVCELIEMNVLISSPMKRRTERLPTKQQKQNEQQHNIDPGAVRAGVAEMRQQSPYQPDQHQNPVAESESHFVSPLATFSPRRMLVPAREHSARAVAGTSEPRARTKRAGSGFDSSETANQKLFWALTSLANSWPTSDFAAFRVQLMPMPPCQALPDSGFRFKRHAGFSHANRVKTKNPECDFLY